MAITSFRNLLLALAVDDAKRQRALLLHYAGEGVNEIFETLPNTLKKTKTRLKKLLRHLQTISPQKSTENTMYMCFAKPSKKATKTFMGFTLVCEDLIPRRRNSSREIIFAKYGWLHMIESFEFVHILSFRSE